MSTSIVVAAGIAALAWTWRRRPEQQRAVLGVVAAGGLSFQLFHFLEHVLQAGAWAVAPGRPPFLTPWAVAGRDLLAVGGTVRLGEELLHLVGNVVFLAGVLGLAALAARSGTGGSRSLRLALIAQGIHLAEHVVLTVTAFTAGRSIGVTTVFGLLEPGPLLWTLRVAAHLGLNTVATAFAATAVLHWTRATGCGAIAPAWRHGRGRGALRRV